MAIIQSGKFISAGENVNLNIRSGVDYINVYNYTQLGAQNDAGVQFFWQVGMDAGTGIETRKTGASDSVEMIAMTSGGFTLFDNSVYTVGNKVATTASSNATKPVIDTGTTAGLATGTVVRLSGIAAVPTICGIDFEIDDVIASTSFRIRWALANAPGAVGGAGFYRIVPNEPIYAPRRRFVVNIVKGATTVVTTSITHGYSVGEEVRMYVPSAANGMVEINDIQGKILSVDLTNNTFTLDIDSSAFTSFVWPAAAESPYTPAQCMAFGAQASDNGTFLEDATRNEAFIGITLGAGADGPAGVSDDVIYWEAVAVDANQFTDFTA